MATTRNPDPLIITEDVINIVEASGLEDGREYTVQNVGTKPRETNLIYFWEGPPDENGNPPKVERPHVLNPAIPLILTVDVSEPMWMNTAPSTISAIAITETP